jgi:colanic acid biosynthesis glycosyl transferase WcaI
MAERLAARGEDVRLFTTFPHYPEWRFVDGVPPRTAVSDEHGVRVARLRHWLPLRGSAVSRVLSELSFGARVLLRRWGSPDAVVLVSPAMFASALLVPRLLLQRVPFCVWVQDLYGLGVEETAGGRPGLGGRAVAALEGWMLRRADVVLVIHEQMSAAVQRMGVDGDRIAVVRNWTHIDAGTPFDRARLREELGWRPDELVVLHSGNMGVKQDLRNVVRAARPRRP